MQGVILIRVSSRDQEEGHSLHAQKVRLIEYCNRKNIEVLEVFEIVESSTIGDRKKFYKMIEFIKAQKGKVALVADAVDRVQRSFKESILLDELRLRNKVELHFYREGIILNENSKQFEIMMWDYSVIGAKSYVLAISENVKRSIEDKLRKGECIGKAPVGYLNLRDPYTAKTSIVLDEKRSNIVRRIFELYATGEYSIDTLSKYITELGLTSNIPPHKPLSVTHIHRILKNPWYYGYMKVKGKMYKHIYPPLITEELFHQCTAVREGWFKKPFKYASAPFTFRGLIRCGYCGCAISLDRK